MVGYCLERAMRTENKSELNTSTAPQKSSGRHEASPPKKSPGYRSAVMKVRQAAAYVGLSVSMLDKMRVEGTGPVFVRLSARSVAYRREDLDAFLAARRCRSTSDHPPLNTVAAE
jgi:predicted DNA-binding transcriptional regulator AlpA